MCIHNQNYLLDAIDTVLSWELPDELFSIAVNDQAKLLAGFDAEDIWAGDAMFNYSLGNNFHWYN